MSTVIHFLDVGQGNMVLVQCANGENFVVDCNITEDNKTRVINYLRRCMGQRSSIKAFICTHRDADHMRGIRDLHSFFPIQSIWDSRYSGTSTDSEEYKAYMRLRTEIPSGSIVKGSVGNYGRTRFWFLSSKDARLPGNANDQGFVIKVEQLAFGSGSALSSVMLPGDSSFATWKDGIMRDYSSSHLSCDILMAAHHGSLDFFDDPGSRFYYESHIAAMSPAMTVISVGKNNYGHPDPTAIRLYTKHSKGAGNGAKLLRTDQHGTVKLILQSSGGWNIAWRQ